MEPKSSAPSPEQLPTPIEYGADTSGAGYEAPRISPEIIPATPERGQELHSATTLATPAQAVALLAPAAPSVQDDDASSAVVQGNNPVVAADEDLIEKEWVDKAKQIVATTKDDPHAREREVNKLQVDYLKKRYGKELGSSA